MKLRVLYHNLMKPPRTPIYVEAERMLPTELHSVFEQLVMEYRFASLKHHGREFASPKVIAELILMGWRSPPSQSDLRKG